MAKTTKTTKRTLKTPAALRKGLRAYVGVYGAAYERALPVFEKITKNYDEFATKGEKLENVASSYAKDLRTKAKTRLETRAAKIRAFFPKAANDRVAELEAEIVKLNKKLAAKAKAAPKKTAKRVTKVTKKAVQTVKTA